MIAFKKKSDQPKEEEKSSRKRSASLNKKIREKKIRSYKVGFSLFLVGASVLTALGMYFSSVPDKLHSFLFSSYCAIQKTMGFEVREIIIQGRHKTPQEKLKQSVEPKIGDPLFIHDINTIKEKILEIDWIEDCTVYRQLPDQFFINIKERHPVALWHFQEKFFLIDAQGIPISIQNPSDYVLLPLFNGENAPKAATSFLKKLEQFSSLKKEIENYVRIRSRRWDIILKSGVIIRLPEEFKNEEKLSDILKELDNLLKSKDFCSDNIESIDYRIENKKFIKKKGTKAPS